MTGGTFLWIKYMKNEVFWQSDVKRYGFACVRFTESKDPLLS